ncbi:LysE family translocator [Reinekea sp. G2M2-21]|uniref:LysE family translocator n=1 Tax=Reinekea sp. G2M2-21 TaxID=2788942 RepID=UPI0018AC1F7D|nr:LysE family translocator [Reinekea sp. G2M2-21]
MSLLISMGLFALVGAITPGPVNLVATNSGARFGFLRTLPHVMGASVAYLIVVLTAGLGLSRLLEHSRQLQLGMAIVGGLFILYLALKIASAQPQRWQADDLQRPPGWWSGALLQWLNPKAWLVASSGVSLFILNQDDPVFVLTSFASLSLLICVISVGTWAFLGQALQILLTTSDRQRWFNRIMALLLVLSIASLWLSDSHRFIH